MLGDSGAYASSPEKILKIWCSLVCFGVFWSVLVYILIRVRLEKFPKN